MILQTGRFPLLPHIVFTSGFNFRMFSWTLLLARSCFAAVGLLTSSIRSGQVFCRASPELAFNLDHMWTLFYQAPRLVFGACCIACFFVTNLCAWHWGVSCLKLGSFQWGVRLWYVTGCIARRGELNTCSLWFVSSLGFVRCGQTRNSRLASGTRRSTHLCCACFYCGQTRNSQLASGTRRTTHLCSECFLISKCTAIAAYQSRRMPTA